jgi:hypothetical protein
MDRERFAWMAVAQSRRRTGGYGGGWLVRFLVDGD